MSFDKPQAPDPVATSNAQAQYNAAAATTQNKTNSYNQTGPLGGVTYVADSSSPSGYRVQITPGEIGKTQLGTAADLAKSSAGMYSTPFNGENKAVTDKLDQWSANYVQPIFNQQDSNLEAQLRNQGLMPGTQAYDNAKNLLARNQGDVTNQYLKQNQQQAFDQALKEYQTPLQTIAGLEQTGAPQGFQPTPTAQVQPPNYAGAVQSNYQNQMQSYNDTWNNIGKLGTAGIGLAMAPFTGGASLAGTLAGGIGSMFSSGPMTLGGSGGPMPFY